MGLLLTCDEEIVVRVKASYTTMKTLALGLMELIDAFEKTTGRNVLTIADINTAMDSNHQEGLIRGQRI